jgi:hypothetical protein
MQPRIAIRGLCLHGFNTSNLSIGDGRATIDMNHSPGQENRLWWCGIYKESREVNAGTPRIQIEEVTWLQIEKVIWLQVEKVNSSVVNILENWLRQIVIMFCIYGQVAGRFIP